MEKKLYYISSNQTNPYWNLALEDYLLHSVKPDEVIFYLWQNERTVVVGRNQNSWKECNLTQLEKDRGFLARRLSGGGAVFHDLGNLNFTFLAQESNYDVSKQLDVIVEAVKKLGISAEKSGRNDIVVNDKKFSGNAFYKAGKKCNHHGTLLLDVDMEKLPHYLNVAPEKLQMKGVDSVRSRVVNLKELNPDIDLVKLKKALIESFQEVYKGTLEEKRLSSDAEKEIQKRAEFFGSSEWNYGKKISFDYEVRKRFSWGDVWLQVQIDKGRVQNSTIWSDGLDADFLAEIPSKLVGEKFYSAGLVEKLKTLPEENLLQKEMKKDLIQWIYDQEI